LRAIGTIILKAACEQNHEKYTQCVRGCLCFAGILVKISTQEIIYQRIYLYPPAGEQLLVGIRDTGPDPPSRIAKTENVGQGRWEDEGAMWVEPDMNLVSGESIILQILYGKRFFKEEFGVDCKVLWLPDVFGYTASLPQILKKSGVDYFITSKISWNDTNTLPYDTFIWEGIDGTEIFTTFITGQSYDKGKGCARGTTYVGNNDSDFIYGTWERQAQKAYVSGALNTYGYGDGGGGPSKDMLEKLRRLMRGLPGFPVATTELLLPFMERQERDFLENAKKLRRTPKWVGELYLEFHRGTYTTMADNKRDNRRSELALVKCEALGYTDLLFGGSYPEKELNDAWLTVLHDQFHDILPGSSIEGVYKLSAEDYKRVLSLTEKLTDEKLRAIAARLDTDGGVLVYNPLGFARRGRITVGGKSYVTGEKIPALGYKVIKPVPGESGISAKRGVLENDIYDIRLDRAGRITSVYDKRFCREVLSGAASEIRFYEDYPHEYDAWEIDKDYGTKMYILDTDAAESIIYDGDRTGIRYEQKYMSSTVYHTVWLTEGSPRIDIEVEVDWHEKHQLMKLAFPLAVRSQSATFEIQYGHTQRPTHRNTSWDEAKFEVCAHKWMDISETGYGVAILNDSKYGHSVEGQTVTVTCLRAPTEPNANADMGKHKFTVSLLPHEGDIKNGKVIEAAYDLNQPLIAMQIPAAHGDLSESFSLAESSSPSVIIECAKKAEDSDDLILRLYEAHNSKTETTISVHPDFKICHLCDLLERPVRVLPVRDGKVTLSMRNFEIETLRFSKG